MEDLEVMSNTLKLLKSTYKGKKVFLTGHTGFKGSWMLSTLSYLGADIKGYSLSPNTDPNIYDFISGNHYCESVIADINDFERLRTEILNFKPDFIFHLAAQPLVRESYQNPLYTFHTNAIGTLNVLESLKGLPSKCMVVCVTTDKVYQNNEWQYPYREEEPLGGYDPYSASKAMAEIGISSYTNSFFNSKNVEEHQKFIVSARAGNVIGGGDWSKDRIIPDVVNALNNGESISVRNPNAVRPWQHVLEPVIGYLILGAKLSETNKGLSKAYNFGPNPQDTFTVGQLVEMAIKIWGKGEWYHPYLENQPHEANLLKLDISKAGVELNWHPIWDAKTAISQTLEWYKNFNLGIDLTLTHIKQYLAHLDQD